MKPSITMYPQLLEHCYPGIVSCRLEKDQHGRGVPTSLSGHDTFFKLIRRGVKDPRIQGFKC